MSNNSYGCRLKNTYVPKDNEEYFLRGRSGHFKSYLPAYQLWQRNGLEEITQALKNNKKVIAVTADLKKFYHRIEPSFLLGEPFQNYIEASLDSSQEQITHYLVSAIQAWSQKVYLDINVPSDFKYNQHSGIPMGLGASKTIANLLLIFLDHQIEQEIKPLYYGRYVDDIFLVLEDGSNIKTAKDFWRFIKRRSNYFDHINISENFQNINNNGYKPEGNVFFIPYAIDSLVEFSSDKEKYFFLEGISGESFLSTIKESLDENTSEWNLPPDINNDIESFTGEVSKATTNTEEAANSLRKSDGLSIQRLKFILYLKRLEVIISFYPKEKWESPIARFFNLCLEHAITLETITTYIRYYPRILSLAVKSSRLDIVEEFVSKIEDFFSKLNKSYLKEEVPLQESKEYIYKLFKEAILSTIEPDSFNKIKEIKFLKQDNQYNTFQEKVEQLIVADLHKIPYKDYFNYQRKENYEFLFTHTINPWNELDIDNDYLPNYSDFKIFSEALISKTYPDINSRSLPYGLYFFTRPFSLFELSILFSDWYNNMNQFKKYCRLFKIPVGNIDKYDIDFDIHPEISPIRIDTFEADLNRTIAFTSFETKNESWEAVVLQETREPDKTRIERLFELVNSILTATKRKKIDYVLFPELSIPPRLLNYISSLLLKKKISLITGVEYEESTPVDFSLPPGFNRFVTNQLFFILTTKDPLGASHIVLKQEKIIPAQKEERELFAIGGAILHAKNRDKYLINHGGFCLGGLICNDFLDINYRAMFRGLIDALVIVEWNMDIETYNSLVESSANDLHAFIMQVNNRLYGDTRLRGPYKEVYERDQVRVRGGELDYFVVATLRVKELREFQKHHRSPNKPFKPVPTGFKISDDRRSNQG